MKKLVVVFILLILAPFSFSVAHASEETQEVQLLIKQVQILLQEVERLQAMLLPHRTTEADFKPLKEIELKETISKGVSWFKTAQEENGHFRYEYLPYEDKYLPLDNIVRQAGGLYALGEVASHDEENKLDLEETLQKSIGFFNSLSAKGEWNGYVFKCIKNSEHNDICQLGATSLALVGLIDAADRFPDIKEKYDDLIHSYGKYIVAMKKEGSGFRHAYNSGSSPSEEESSFSNGEALLALVRYYKYSPDEDVKKVIDDSFTYFNSEDVPFDFPLYLWVMAAIKDMNELWEKEEYVEYVREYTKWRLNGFAHRKGSNHNMCAYVEGVASAYSVLRGNIEAEELDSIQNEINYWLRRSLDLQVGDSDVHRIIHAEDRSFFGEIVNKEKSFGGFLTDQNELTQRIDFTQHCINSYLQQHVDINGGSI